MTTAITIVFVFITIIAVISFLRKNIPSFDRAVSNFFNTYTYVKLTMHNGDEDVYAFADSRQMLAFVEEAKLHSRPWIPEQSRVKSYEIIKHGDYTAYKEEREEISNEYE
jgi:hypothetical protein